MNYAALLNAGIQKELARRAHHRKNAAALAREIRAMWPTVKGNWTRRDWNQQALAAARNHVSNMLHFDKVNK